MRFVLSLALTLLVVAGLSYACYEIWLLLDKQIRGTFLASFKFIPAIVTAFLVLSAADMLLGWVERRFVPSNAED